MVALFGVASVLLMSVLSRPLNHQEQHLRGETNYDKPITTQREIPLIKAHEYLIGILENEKLFCGIVWLLEAGVNDCPEDPPRISHVQ